MKWIKASERLPEIDGKYICRKSPVSNDDIYVSETFFNNGKFQTGHIIIEWLDESPPSGGKSAEDVEKWYRKWMADRGKSGIATVNVLDMLKDFASQYAHQQPVPSNWNRPLEVTDLVEYPSTHQQPVHNKYSGYDTRTVIEFNLSKDGKYLDRNDKEITTEMLTNHYQIIHEDWGILFIDAQQPVQGYSMEQVNEAMDKIETMEALENTMKPQYQQPVHDGCKKVHNIEDAPKYLGDG